MKKISLTLISFSLALFFCLTILVSPVIDQYVDAKPGLKMMKLFKKNHPKRDRMDLAWEQEVEMTKDPVLGYVPRERLLEAWKYKESLLAQKAMYKSAIPGIQWTERGPDNLGGRTRAIHFDLSDQNFQTVWAGSVAGGLWKTTNINSSNPSWTPIDDFLQNIAITSIAQGTTNKQIMYFGTGEGNGNSDAVRGLGVWKSSNGGSTWTQLLSTNNSNFYYCQKILTKGNGDTVFVCTRSGLFRSVNGGTSFTNVLSSGVSGALGSIAQDIEMAANSTLYVSMSSSSTLSGTIHKSYNFGASWTNPLTIPSYVQSEEIELAMAQNDTNTVWALIENGNRISAIIKTTNAGLTWDTVIAHPVDADSGIPGSGNPWKDFSRGQSWYDLSLAVDPNNKNICYVGGVDLFRTINGGTSWQQVSHWYGGFGFQEVHADQHNVVYAPQSSATCLFSNDGGVYISFNANSTSTPQIQNRGNGYRTGQFYACDIHPTAFNNFFLAGAQDNGSHRFSSAGMNSTVEVTGGDGAFCHIDQDQPQYMWTSYVYNNYYRSTNGGTSFTSVSFGNTGSFINPTDYDDLKNIMYCTYNTGTYLRWNNPQSGSTTTSISISAFNSARTTAVKVSPNVSNRVYFGTTGGRIVQVDSAHLATPIAAQINVGVTGMPTTTVSSIDVETNNEDHILVTYSSYGVTSVWETRNGGSTWINIEGNLPDMPIRWILLSPSSSYKALVATELGVWSTDSLNGTLTNWQPSNSGLSNVRTDMLKMRNSDKMVIVATHGRGLFSTDIFASANADFVANKTVSYIGKSVQFTNTSSGATSVSWNFGDSTYSSVMNPVKVYTTAGKYTVSLSINSGASTKVITNYITILPFRGVPYTPAAGGNFDVNPNDFAAENEAGTPFERGNSSVSGKNGTNSGSFAWVTGLVGNYVDNTTAYLYTPNFNFTSNGTYTLRFRAKNNLEIAYDGFVVEYSINGGNTWQQVGMAIAPNWYDFANTSSSTAFPLNVPYFNATRSAFTLLYYDVSNLSQNAEVCFRFVFKTDPGVVAPGVAIDDFEILGPNNAPLPVKLISFSAKRTSKDMIALDWATGSEQNNKGFFVERKLNFTDDFESIGFVKGIGNRTAKQIYSFNDPNQNPNTTFYRLKQVDFDQTSYYSKVISVKGFSETNEKLVDYVYPLVTARNFSYVSSQAKLNLKVINNKGQLVKLFSNTDSNIIVDLSGFATGVYYFMFSDISGKTQIEKVVLY